MERTNKNISEDLLGNYLAMDAQSNEPQRSFMEIISGYLRHWRWFILSVATCLAVGVAIVMTTEKQYKSNATVLIDEDKNKGGSKSSTGLSLDDLGLLATTNNIDNEIVILTSPDLMHTVVDSLNLATHYTVRDRFRDKELYDNAPFTATYSKRFQNFPGVISFSITKDGNSFKIEGEYVLSEQQIFPIHKSAASLPVTINLPDSLGSIHVSALKQPMDDGVDYQVSIVNPNAVATGLVSALSVTQTSKNSSALKMDMSVNNVSKGAAVLKQLVRQYNLQNTRVNNEISYNTALFINERLKEIAVELSDVERDVVDYKQKNRIADLPTEAQLSIAQSGQNKQKMMDAETQLNVIDLVERFVKDPANDMKVIPNLGVSDLALASIINDYNVKLLTSETLIKNTGPENPTRIKVLDEIRSMHSSIINSLRNVRRAYQIGKRDLQQMSGSTQSQIQAIPQQEKGLLERVRQQQVKENLFLFLMQKREETNISIASISEKARMVASPQMNTLPIAPNTRMILMAAFLFGLLIPVAIIYVINMLRTHVGNREELKGLTPINIVGQISRGSDPLVVHVDPKGIVTELFRSLRNNLNFIFKNKDHRVVLVTSSVSGEGKTFVSTNLALTYTLSGKKVLLIGGDIRKPQLKKIMDLQESKGLSDYLAQDQEHWNHYLITGVLNPNLDVMISGTIPPNPNELLMSPKLGVFLNDAKEKYDIVIVDTAPVGMVSDTFLYNDYMDTVLYVVREGVTPKDSIEYINTLEREKRFHSMYIILNDSVVDSHYGYKYGYGKGYGYYARKED